MPPRPLPTPSLQSWRANLPNRVHEASAPATCPEAPGFISATPELLEAWERVCGHLRSIGVLSEVDADVIGRYVSVADRHRKAADYLRLHGSTYEIRDRYGNIRQIKPHPMVAEANNTAAACLKLERELGLTPAARVALPASSPPSGLTEEEEIDNLILGITK